jgi:predicted enzyme related to lactoylglutathione lyase
MATIGAYTFDAHDAAAEARFWAEVLGWDVNPEADEHAAYVGGPKRPPGSAPLAFYQVPEDKTVKNRAHLDLTADDLEAEVERLVGLGATVVHEKEEWGARWFTLTDPEGNEFCVSNPHEIPSEPDS